MKLKYKFGRHKDLLVHEHSSLERIKCRQKSKTNHGLWIVHELCINTLLSYLLIRSLTWESTLYEHLFAS